MTENDIERAARKLCEARGVDPNRMVRVICNCGKPDCAAPMQEPIWKAFEPEIRAFLEVRDAIASTMQ